jgi:hypothetical protein
LRAAAVQRHIAIVTYKNDLHALGVQALLRQARDRCDVIESDRLAASNSLSWSLDSHGGSGIVRNVDGEEVEVAELDALWWRRHARLPEIDPERLDPAGRDFAASNIRAALLGLFLTDFRGVWVDHPEAIRRAENKLLQLRMASAMGLRVPRTLVSQDPERIRAFHRALRGRMIIKAAAGTWGVPALTGEVGPEILEDADPLELCPAIYQELVPGDRHLRVHCFGEDVRAAVIESESLDWRHPLDVAMEPFTLSADLTRRLLALLAQLDLRMGVFDLKLSEEDGEPVWLELNPQGQFLFVEALGGGELLKPFARFLRNEAQRGGRVLATASPTEFHRRSGFRYEPL